MKLRFLIIQILLLFYNGVYVYCQTVEKTLQDARELYAENAYEQAIEKFLLALRSAESEGDHALAARISLSLARCHYFLYDHKASYKWTYNALDNIDRYKVDSLRSDAYYFLGVLYIEDEKLDSAEFYAYKAITLMKREGDYAHVSQTYSTLAELYMNTTRDRDRIESMIDEAQRFANLSADPGMKAFVATKLYNYNFYVKRNYSKALESIQEAERLYKKTGNREAILNTYRAKAECLIMLRDTTARMYMQSWFEFKDSVLQADKSKAVAKYETLYETEKSERQNQLLQKENERNRLIITVVLIALFLILTLGLWLFSRANLKKKEQELIMIQNIQRDKERIARDLHDNVGGQLSFILYSMEGIEKEEREKQKEISQSINLSVRSVINSLRETIWAISHSNIGAQDFSDKLKFFARNLFKYSSVEVNYTEKIEADFQLKALPGLNLFRICQEVLNNAMKHANASEISIAFESDSSQLCISIQDNGIGFDVHKEYKTHYGLVNIRKRAEEFGISMTLNSESGKGSSFTLKLVHDAI